MESISSELQSTDLRTPWQRLRDRVFRGSAFLASAILHSVILLVIFANIVFYQEKRDDRNVIIDTRIFTDVQVEPASPDIALDEPIDEPLLRSPMLLPAAVNPSHDSLPENVTSLDTGAAPALDASMGLVDVLAVPAVGTSMFAGGGGIGLMDRVSTGGTYQTLVWRMTDQMGAAARGYRGVQLTWLMDASISMRDDAEAIAQRVHDIYGTLSAGGQKITMSIIAFGEKPRLWLRPTDNLDHIVRALITVPVDMSGRENVMQALQFAARTMSAPDGFKNVFCILTDERGDDNELLEPTLRDLRNRRITVYVIGREAFFQDDTGHEQYYDEQSREMRIGVTQRGPETARYERFWLPLWSGGVPSGFGPYALSRLAVYTGGSYFLLHTGAQPPKPGARPLTASGYDPERLQFYRPDLSAIRAYDVNLKKDRAYQQLMAIYNMRDRLKAMYDGPFFTASQFPAIRERILANIQIWEEIVQEFNHNMVPDHVLEKMPERRWVAHYDAARATATLSLYNNYQNLLSVDRARQKTYPFRMLKISHRSLPAIVDQKEAAYREATMSAFSDVARRHASTPWERIVQPMLKSSHSHFRSWEIEEYIPPKPSGPSTPGPSGPPPI